MQKPQLVWEHQNQHLAMVVLVEEVDMEVKGVLILLPFPS